MFNLTDYYIELGGSNGKFFKRKEFIQLKDPDYNKKVADFLSKYNVDSYYGIYAYENIEDVNNCKIYGDLYFDLDGNIHTQKGFNKLKEDVIKMSIFLNSYLHLSDNEYRIYFSGAKGFHITVGAKVLGVEPSTDLNMIYKAWANYLHETFNINSLDLVIYDRKRLFRIPETINSKTGLKKQLVDIKTIRFAKNYEEFIANINLINNKESREDKLNVKAALAFYSKSQNFYKKKKEEAPQNNRPIVIPKEKEELLPCVQNALITGANIGSRNNTLVTLSSAIMQSGYTMYETLELMHNWNDNNEKPLSYHEIEMTVRSAYSMLLTGKRYGCKALKEFGYCIGEKCKIEERRRET